ncbi:hypothetical protein AOLI_G00252310 [Acnodon oligacanthus]
MPVKTIQALEDPSLNFAPVPEPGPRPTGNNLSAGTATAVVGHPWAVQQDPQARGAFFFKTRIPHACSAGLAGRSQITLCVKIKGVQGPVLEGHRTAQSGVSL